MSDKEQEHETVARWMTYLERQGKSPLTREAYLNTVMIYTQPSLEDLNQRMERVVL